MRRHRVAKRASGQRLEVVERLQDMTRKSLGGVPESVSRAPCKARALSSPPSSSVAVPPLTRFAKAPRLVSVGVVPSWYGTSLTEMVRLPWALTSRA